MSTANPIACNLAAISPADRPRYNQLVRRIRAAMTHRDELPNGYAYPLHPSAIPMPEAAEWITMETLCCPFLTLQLTVSGHQQHYVLTLTGPDGIKPLLDIEFPIV
ncbi:MAG: hypothetical protein JST93_18405 [Acidobacteria bacterium]|nr:hypothetical protein [Acidobacteriota bacterium]